MPRIAIVWFRQDFRLTDNPALRHACAEFDVVVPVFVWSPEAEGIAAAGAASRVWLHASLGALSKRLEKCGGGLVIRAGDPRAVLPEMVSELGAAAVFWNRRYEPPLTAIDSEVKETLTGSGIEARSFKANLLFEPWEISTNDGGPYKVFTPFWRRCEAELNLTPPLPEVRVLRPVSRRVESLAVDALELLPTIRWDGGIRDAWEPGEMGARTALRAFLRSGVAVYTESRDFPWRDGVSRLSPHLHFGEIGPRQIFYEAMKLGKPSGACAAFLRQIGWRDFAHHVLYHFPETISEPLQPQFRNFQWRIDADQLRAWQRGRTGYPIVDAGMRQLWRTGWMHNRVRMIVASFLVKDLLISWREGAAWFWDTLVDADLANNTLGWQWAGGCGADAAPYFRIFNPVLQGRKFDSEGDYVRQWVPELARVPARWIHEPWNASAEVLHAAGVRLGEHYPKPIVDHGAARDEALKRFKSL